MAAPDELSDCAVLAVLVPDDGRLRFCRSDLANPQIGDWVELQGAQGSESARIVFGPGQVEYANPPADLPRIQRRLTPDEIAGLDAVARPERNPAVRFGSLGRLHPRTNDLDAHVRVRLGLNPPGGPPVTPQLLHLGTSIQTAHGQGILLAVSMRHQSARIRLESGEEVRVPVGELE